MHNTLRCSKPDRAWRFAAIARSRPLAGLLALTVVYLFLHGPVGVPARKLPGSALPPS